MEVIINLFNVVVYLLHRLIIPSVSEDIAWMLEDIISIAYTENCEYQSYLTDTTICDKILKGAVYNQVINYIENTFETINQEILITKLQN